MTNLASALLSCHTSGCLQHWLATCIEASFKWQRMSRPATACEAAAIWKFCRKLHAYLFQCMQIREMQNRNTDAFLGAGKRSVHVRAKHLAWWWPTLNSSASSVSNIEIQKPCSYHQLIPPFLWHVPGNKELADLASVPGFGEGKMLQELSRHAWCEVRVADLFSADSLLWVLGHLPWVRERGEDSLFSVSRTGMVIRMWSWSSPVARSLLWVQS